MLLKLMIMSLGLFLNFNAIQASVSIPPKTTLERFKMPSEAEICEFFDKNRINPNHIKNAGTNRYVAKILANQRIDITFIREALYGFLPKPENYDPVTEMHILFLIKFYPQVPQPKIVPKLLPRQKIPPKPSTSIKMPDYASILGLLNSNQPWHSPFFYSPNNSKIATELANQELSPEKLKKVFYQYMPDSTVDHPEVESTMTVLIKITKLIAKTGFSAT